MIIIPAIDLRQGRCVRLTQGARNSTVIYDGQPADLAQAYEGAGVSLIHVVDLDGAFSEPNSANRQTLSEIIRSINIPVQFGGGLRTIEQVHQVLDLGVARVVIGTLAFEERDALRALLTSFGSEKIAVGIDAKDGSVVTRGWERDEGRSALQFARQLALDGVERIIYTDVACDGMLRGINIDATCEIARFSGLKVTASGGVSSLDDIARVAKTNCGIDSVIVGKAIYEGRFTIEEALLAAK